MLTRALGRVRRRDVEAIEFSSFDTLGAQRNNLPIRVDQEFMARVTQVKASRRPTQEKLDTLEGTITALDISEGKLQLSIREQGRRVRGTFAKLYLPALLESLGRRVRLEGHVERKGRIRVSIQVVSALVLSED